MCLPTLSPWLVAAAAGFAMFERARELLVDPLLLPQVWRLEREWERSQVCRVILRNCRIDLYAWHRSLLGIAMNERNYDGAARKKTEDGLTLERRSMRLNFDLSPRAAASSPRLVSSSWRCCKASMTVRGSGALTGEER